MESLCGRHFLTLQDLMPEEITAVLELSRKLKEKQQRGEPHHLLEGKTLGMIFQKPSTRTRVSFEVGMWQLGGYALFLSSQELQMGRGEPIRDTAAVLSRYVDGIMVRTFEHEQVEELAAHAGVPVINALTDYLHPCQVLADLLTIEEKLGRLHGVKLGYVGDGNNVAHSLLLGCSRMGMEIRVGAPPGHGPKREVVERAKENSRRWGGQVLVTEDPIQAVEGVDVVYTDVWASMGQDQEKEARKQIFEPYQVNQQLLNQASAAALVMHCLPAYRGEEITIDVLEGDRAVVLDQAENRLHAQKGLLALIM